MSWSSLWWRVCLLARLHARRVRVAWLLWRRSRRTLRVVLPRGLKGLPAVRWDFLNIQATQFAETNRIADACNCVPDDIIYVPNRFGYGEDMAATNLLHGAVQAKKILAAHEAMLQQQRDAMLKVEL